MSNPTISGLSPNMAEAGEDAITLTINGTNFAAGAQVSWLPVSLPAAPTGGTAPSQGGGLKTTSSSTTSQSAAATSRAPTKTDLVTTFVSATQLTASLPAYLIAEVGLASVTVTTAGGTSAGAKFTIIPPPVISSLVPKSAQTAGPPFTLTINGVNFMPGATAYWINSSELPFGLALTTTFVSATQLTAAVPANLIALAGTAWVTVRTLTFGGAPQVAFTIGPGTLNGVYWTPVGPAPVASPGPGQGGNAGRVNAAAADPNDPDVVYLATGGVWSTSEAWAGNTPRWQPLTDDQPSLVTGGVHSMSVHPANSNLVQACVCWAGAGILRSTQAGALGSWQLMGNSVFNTHCINGIAAHPSNTQQIYAATDIGLWVSNDGGQTWTQVGGGLPATGLADIVFARFDSNTLFASICGNGVPDPNAGVYFSTDGGTNWALVSGLPNGVSIGAQYANSTIRMDTGPGVAVYVAMLTVDPGTTTITAVQRFRSMDQGKTWSALAPSPGGLETRGWHMLVAVDPQNDNHVFVNDAYSLFESTTGGIAADSASPWTQRGGGYDWCSASFDANGAVLATADQGIFRYTPGANTWESLIGNLQVATFYTITINSSTICGTGQDQYGAMIAQNAPGASWHYLQAGGETGKVLLPPMNTTYAYLYNPLSDNAYDLVWRAAVTGALQPADAWTPLLSKNIYGSGNYGAAYAAQKAFVMDAANPGRLLLGADQVWETTAANAPVVPPQPAWSAIGPPPQPGIYVTAIAIAPSAPNTIYVATSDQHVWATTNGGGTWAECDSGLYGVANGAIQAMSVDPTNPNHVFAVGGNAFGSSKVWELGAAAAPNQQTWLGRSGPSNQGAYGIVVGWQYATPWLVIGTDRGVYASANLGGTWSRFGGWLPNIQVNDLQCAVGTNPAGTTSILAAATYGRGAFEILVGPSTIAGQCVSLANATLAGLGGVTMFLDASGDGTLDLNDLQTPTDGKGNYLFAKVPPGVYTVRAISPPGYISISPAPTVTVNGSALTNVNVNLSLPQHVPPPQFRLGTISGR